MSKNFSVTADTLLVWLTALCLISSGCRSTEKSGDGPFAAVLISGNTPGQIRDAAVEVFVGNGFKSIATAPTDMVFEKQASRMSNFAYGSWLGDDPVLVRVKAAVIPVGEMKFRLECTAYLVRDRGGATEEQIPVSRMHRGTYQKMVDQVAQRFSR